MFLAIVLSISVLLSSAAFADLYGKGKGLSKGNTEETSEEDNNIDTDKQSDENKDKKTLLPKASSPSKKDSGEDKDKDTEKEPDADKSTGTPSLTVAPDIEKELEKDNKTDQETYDFKKFRWGDSQEYVMEIEGAPDGEDDMVDLDSHYIVYITTLAGKDALLAYYFCDEGLWQARYILTESYSNYDLYIDDYEKVKEQLTKKFGDPLLDLESWEYDDKEEEYKNKKGDALYEGYLTYWTWYQTDTTDIDLDMSASNHYIATDLTFASLDIYPDEINYPGEPDDPDEPDYSDDF